MSKPAFVGRFLLVFALLIVIGWATDAPARYARLLRAGTAALSPVVTGWWIETVEKGTTTETFFRHGETELKLLLSLDALALGLLPLLSLLGATPGLGWRRLLGAVAIGVVALFALDSLVLLLYPALVAGGAASEIAGFFLGILTFVGGPIILWFVLTFDRMRDVWRFPTPAIRAPNPPRASATRR